MKPKKILITIGTRPNFIKVSLFKKLAQNFSNLEVKVLHTGQHYDYKMAKIFFDQFDMEPDFFLEIGKGSPNQQIGKIIISFEKFIEEEYRPDIILVPGDVNSTAAVAVAANKLGIKLGHIESGLRSFDRTMPEEFNRLIADELSDYYFVSEPSGIFNLEQEKKKGEIFYVGNTMIDTMVAFESEISESRILNDLQLTNQEYCLCTFHRPALVDNLQGLEILQDLLAGIAKSMVCVFPIHPRTKLNIQNHNMWDSFKQINGLKLLDPIGYFEFQKLIKHGKFILTDSGGIQEESTFRKVPCITLRPNTERPITTDIGSNTLLPLDSELIQTEIQKIVQGEYKKSEVPDLWDGNTTKRILKIISEEL